MDRRRTDVPCVVVRIFYRHLPRRIGHDAAALMLRRTLVVNNYVLDGNNDRLRPQESIHCVDPTTARSLDCALPRGKQPVPRMALQTMGSFALSARNALGWDMQRHPRHLDETDDKKVGTILRLAPRASSTRLL